MLSILLIDSGWVRQLIIGVILRALLTDSQSHERAAKRDGAGVGSREFQFEFQGVFTRDRYETVLMRDAAEYKSADHRLIECCPVEEIG